MEDVRDVGAELHRLAEAEAQDPFDPMELLQKGRRRKRHRKILTAGGAMAGVAAVALAATLLPNLGPAGNQPQVAGGESEQSMFEPVPGVPRGEEGAGEPVSKAEALRRCALRHPEGKQLILGANIKSGQTLVYRETVKRLCKVPGGDKPSAALVAAAEKDPLPETTAGQLRNCSVQLWVDLTGWRVMASERLKTKRYAGAVLVAVSPSGKKAVACTLSSPPPGSPGSQLGGEGSNTRFLTLDSLAENDPILPPVKGSGRADLFAATGSKSTYTGWGRVAPNATTVRLQLGSGPAHEVKVNDGWFAIAWAKPAEAGGDFGVLKAYDRNGKLVRVISQS